MALDIKNVIMRACPNRHTLAEHCGRTYRGCKASINLGRKSINSSFNIDFTEDDVRSMYRVALLEKGARTNICNWLNMHPENGERFTVDTFFSLPIGWEVTGYSTSPYTCRGVRVVLAYDRPVKADDVPFKCVSMYPISTPDASMCDDDQETEEGFFRWLHTVDRTLCENV